MTIINAPARAFAARPFAAAETATPDPWFDAAAYAQLLGTSDNDLIRGGADDDEIGGLDGEDLLYGAAGDDLVEGGMGQDIVNGGSGHDRLYGNSIANDGGDGADIVIDGMAAATCSTVRRATTCSKSNGATSTATSS